MLRVGRYYFCNKRSSQALNALSCVHTTTRRHPRVFESPCSVSCWSEEKALRRFASNPSSEPDQQQQPENNAISGNDGWMHLPSGLKYREQIQGTGRMPEAGELVKVHYSALIMETDTLYESTYQSQYPFQFCINDGSAIRGINEGVATMKEGGRRLLYVLPHLGYGRFSTPPNITLLIEVELIQIGPDQTWWQKLRSLFS